MKKLKSERVKWGIVGVGDVCEVKSAPAMKLIPNSEIVAVMRRNGEKAADYARRHNIGRWYDDADQLINDPEINAVYIATPPQSHAELALKVAQAGKPAYVEKPMAKSHRECMDMVQAFESRGLPLYVAYYRRALPNFLKIKSLIEAGAIGDIRMVNIELTKSMKPDIIAHIDTNWRVDPTIAGGGYFFDLASHQLDFLDFLLGPIAEATGFAANQAGLYAANDIVVSSFTFENGIMGSGSWCFTAGESIGKDLTTIIGSKGKIEYATFENSDVFLFTDEGGKESFSFEMPKHIQHPLIQQIVDDLLGIGESPSTGQSAARTNLILEKMR